MELVVAADDRTGALETAAALAERGANHGKGVPVTVWPVVDESSGVTVVDLESRHVSPQEAGARAAGLAAHRSSAHKIDSTLRGNWAAELAARRQASGRPVLLVPAFPELGRVCIDGVVLLDGRPVGELGDVRAGAVWSRPADHLAAAGVEVVSLATVEAVEDWSRFGDGIAVADAVTVDDVEAVVGAWRSVNEAGIVLAGTSAVIARAIDAAPSTSPFPDGRVLVVVGSANAVARRQVDALVGSGFDPAYLLATPATSGIVSHEQAAAAASRLMREIDDRLKQADVDVIVVIGGETAAAVLGDDPATVYGTVGAGTALLRSPRYEQTIITRAGGFGDRDALVDLVSGTLRA